MFDDLKIRSKLVLLVAGPIVIIVLLAALGARARQDTASQAAQVERLVAVARANSDVVDALQQEALFSTAMVGAGANEWKSQVLDAREATDAAVLAAVAQLEANTGTSTAFRSSASLAIDAADKLDYIRDAVDQGYRWDQVVTTYSSLQTSFLAVNEAVSEAVVDPSVAGELRTSSALASYKSAVARESAVLVGATVTGGFKIEGSFDLLQEAAADEQSNGAVFNSIARTNHKGKVRDALSTDARIEVEQARNAALQEGSDAKPASDPRRLTVSGATVLTDLHAVEIEMADQMIGASQARRSTAERAADLFIIAAALAILAAALAAVYLGRRITKPLNHLAGAADRLATNEMPRLVESLRNPTEDELGYQFGMEEIRVDSKDEIGRLASAFNDVQRVANEVAAEQAALLRKGIGDMFVNLARRNQALLDRQIEFIDELERGEEDPDQLDNLYRLDHLATRMRRNAESLLVLAGAEPPRRRGRPAPLANVVRAALAEVEDFGRIDLLSFDEVLIASNAAADLAHLLSELMENAANFSPPETKVEVVGHRTKADGYVISVTDHGIGMSAEQVAEANESLAKPPVVGLALSRSLGFIVVGRLAARHGISVRMMPSPSGGVTAVVSIPPSLVTDGPTMAGRDQEPEPASVPSRLKPVLDAANHGASGPLAFSADAAPGAVPAPTAPQVEAPRPVPVAPPVEPLSAPLAPTGPTQPEVVAFPGRDLAPAAGLPSRSFSAASPAPAPPPPAVFEPPKDAPAAAVAEPDALVFSEPPTAPAGTEVAARLDGPPPMAPLPARPSGRTTHTSGEHAGGDRPFFLEDGAPPRLFGGQAPAKPPVPAAPVTPEPAPVYTGRLFGGTGPDGATPPANPTAVPASAPAVTRPGTTPPTPPSPPPAAPAVLERTGSGLAKRVPRQAGAPTNRTMPGSDAERGVGASRRSPDEVRNLLGRFRDGQQRARTDEPVPAGATHERDSHE